MGRPRPCDKCGLVGSFKSGMCADCRGYKTRPHSFDAQPLYDPMWRPKHYPPPCPHCNGFGYRRIELRGSHTACSECRNHPGHTMTHNEWTQQRA